MSPCSSNAQALLDAQLELWHNTFGYVKSMALKSALDLGIADSIQLHGGAATLPEIATDAKVHPSRIPSLSRLMRVLTATGVFSSAQPPPAGDSGSETLHYVLTPMSRLLVGTENQVPYTNMMLQPHAVSSFFELGKWLQRDQSEPCIFDLTMHGKSIWEFANDDATFNASFNDGMVSDTRFIMDIAISEHGEIFHGISSLVDVAGGLGAASQAISKAFPHIKCSVLDLNHVIAKAPTDTDVQYIAGDMFESIPPADVTFFKWVMHDWGNEECVKILKRCKQAIPPRDAGGKVIIIDMVVGAGPTTDLKHREIQALLDLHIMTINGMERNEQEWKDIFFEAGFSDYKITPGLGARSIIEVYP